MNGINFRDILDIATFGDFDDMRVQITLRKYVDNVHDTTPGQVITLTGRQAQDVYAALVANALVG